jgi:hypothetical protein
VSPEDFARILELFSPDPEEAGRRYTSLHKRLTGFFNLKGVSDPLTAADQTIDRAVLKVGAGTIVPDLDKYCLGIARNVAKERRRLMHRENLAFHKFIEELGDFPSKQLERIYGILKPCFELLGVEEQQLLLAYCQRIQGRARAEVRRELAETMKVTMLALRVKVNRLRNRLTDCVQKRSNNVENALPVSNKPEIWSIFL